MKRESGKSLQLPASISRLPVPHVDTEEISPPGGDSLQEFDSMGVTNSNKFDNRG